MCKQAISYVRFSSEIQKKGESIWRQNSLVKAWLDSHPDYTKVREYVDEGLSAYKGDHLKEGSSLWTLKDDILAGKYKPGTVLLVEALDRLSRQGFDETYDLIRSILRAGVNIVFLSEGNDLYTRESLNDTMPIIKIAMKAETAFGESKKKSDRGLMNWSRKREKALKDGVIITRACPKWLQVNEDKTGFIQIPERVKTVKRIFKMRLAGESMSGIAKILNDEKTETFTGRIGAWNQTTVQQLLNNRAVYGVHEVSKQATKEVRDRAEPIPDYYPKVITEHEFNKVLELANKTPGRAPASTDPRMVNLFRGVMVCAHCGASVVQASIKPDSPGYYTYGYFVCSFKRLGRCKHCKAVRRDITEQAITQGLLYNTETLLSGQTDSQSQINELEAQRESVTAKKKRYLKIAALDEDMTEDEIKTELKTFNDQVARIDHQLAELRHSQTSNGELTRVKDLDLTTKAGRVECQLIVKKLIKEIRLDGNKLSCDIEFWNGYKLNSYPLAYIVDGSKWIDALHISGLKEFTFTGEHALAPLHTLYEPRPVKPANQWKTKRAQEREQNRVRKEQEAEDRRLAIIAALEEDETRPEPDSDYNHEQN